jgi:hypothetical protein
MSRLSGEGRQRRKTPIIDIRTIKMSCDSPFTVSR